MDLPFAEDIGHYWKTGESSPDVILGRTRRLIESTGGAVVAEAFGAVEGQAAFMMAFTIGQDNFKVVWPVLTSRTGSPSAAKRQAATLLFHDIKAKVMTASVLGAKVAFFSYLMLGDGRVAGELANPELADAFPLQLGPGNLK